MSQDAASFYKAVICNEVDPKGKTELHKAAEKNDLPEVERLLNLGANINAEDRSGFTPLHAAVYKNHGASHLGVLEKLLNVGSNPNTKNCYDETPIFSLVQKGNAEVVRLFMRFGADVHFINKEGETPLFKTINGGNAEILKLLLENGSDLGNYSSKFLQRAARLNRGESHVDLAEVLLKKGADVNIRDGDGKTPLHCLTKSNGKMVKLFLKYGADLNTQDRKGRTALNAITRNENIDVVPFLIDLGVDVNKLDFGNGKTPLHWACANSEFKVVKSLVKKGLDINAIDLQGCTPLMYVLISRLNHAKDIKPKLKYLLKHSDLNENYSNGRNIFKFSGEAHDWKIIVEFIARLQALDLPGVHQSILETILNHKKFSDYYKKCMEELEVAKSAKVEGCWITFFNVLVDSKKKLKNYAGNRDMVKYFKKNSCVEKFPIYSVWMKENVTKAIKRREVFDKSSIALSNNLPIFNPNHLIIKDVLDCLISKDHDRLVL